MHYIMYNKKGVRARACCVAVITQQGIQTEIRNVCSSFRLNMGDALPKIIKLGPWEGQITDSWHRWCKALFVAMVTIVTVFSVRRHLRMTKQMGINRPKQMSINRPKQMSIEHEILSHWLKVYLQIQCSRSYKMCVGEGAPSQRTESHHHELSEPG